MTGYWARAGWTGSEATNGIAFTVTDGVITDVARTDVRPPDYVLLDGMVLPGLVNTHSHAFHRALRGRLHGLGTFWSWRDGMYEAASSLDPEGYRQLATGVFAEMALAGITHVGEFHYLHHQPSGRPYDDPNEMSQALIDAAATVGIRITLLDTCYLTAAIGGAPPIGVQRRFSDGSSGAWAERHHDLRTRERDLVRIGTAIHSVRAVPSLDIPRVVAAAPDEPIHVHLSEQPAENDDCHDHHGCSPTELLRRLGALTERTTVVHGIHTVPEDWATLASQSTRVCVCPSTEADLGDGFAPVHEMAVRDIETCLGTDAHVSIDVLSEARRVEDNDRSRLQRRGIHDGTALLRMATVVGSRALGGSGGAIEVGAAADFVVVDLESERTAGSVADQRIVFAAGAPDITDVFVAGRGIVRDGRHTMIEDVPRLLRSSIERLMGPAT